MNMPLRTLETTVIEDWIDYNGHLNEAYYLVIFSKATDAFQTLNGMTPESIKAEGDTLFTLETHLAYIQEIGLGAPVYVTSQLLEFDSKRVRIYHRMYNAQDELLATAETFLIGYNLQQTKVSDFHPSFAGNLAQLLERQGDMPMPENAGKGIALKRKK
jgi:acyl-CoA thioester hydrolase